MFHTDSRMPTETERQELCKMLFHALMEIRGLGFHGKSQQAADLADAFHNLPVYLWIEGFSFSFFRHFLESYQNMYGDACRHNYVAMLDEIIEGKSISL
jgi:hypothetical protein